MMNSASQTSARTSSTRACCLVFAVLAAVVIGRAANAADQGFENWLSSQAQTSMNKMVANISPADAARGAVVASPSRDNPNYFYFWVRDAALVMDVFARQYAVANGNMKGQLWRMMDEYVDFSRGNQMTQTITGLGEPKFFANGAPFNDPWGRPQNDSPALRATTLIRFAQQLLNEGNDGYVRHKLYNNTIPAYTVIKSDLEFVAHHWRDSSFDLWEEVQGDHFYTRMVQLAAMRDGAALANRTGDNGAAGFYQDQAHQIEGSLRDFWRDDRGIYRVTLNYRQGIDYKNSELDSAVLLGVLHAGFAGGEFSFADPRVLSTAQKIEESFARIYTVNDGARFPGLGTATGRYPEDRYSGQPGIWDGNPWVLTTAAFAEFYYKLAHSLVGASRFEVNQTNAQFVRAVVRGYSFANNFAPGAVINGGSSEMRAFVGALIDKGDSFMMRVRHHANPDGALSEQIDRNSGHMVSARDLTWSYASFLTAYAARP
jgi:glucoamylase